MTLPYIINAALVLGACLAFYKILLHRETFYRVNRYLLIACLAVSFSLPLLQVPQQYSLRKTTVVNKKSVAPPVVSYVIPQPLHTPSTPIAAKPTEYTATQTPVTIDPLAYTAGTQTDNSTGFSLALLLNWVKWMYWFGVLLFAGSFLFQLVILLYRSLRYPVIIDGRYRIVEMTGDTAPCSFGNTIFINPSKYDWETYNQILLHEKVHIRQRHTFDIILAEIVLIFQWFNPFAWVYRREIENNLEYLTDDQLTQKEQVNKHRYQISLVKVAAPHLPLKLTTNYNQSTLKKRIAMMNKKRSNLHTAWKYFFLLPVFAILACILNEPAALSQQNAKNKKEGKEKTEQNEQPAANGQQEIASAKIPGEKISNKMPQEGYWFAVIKDNEVNIHFSDEKLTSEDSWSGHHNSTTSFPLSELGNLPRANTGTITIIREAGKLELTGKFEDKTGMGTYVFNADKGYVDYMNKELKEDLEPDEEMAFFVINIKKDFVQMLHKEGYASISKDELIPVAALGINQNYIHSMRSAGFTDLTLENLIPLKALGIDDKYVAEIKSVYKNISSEQLISFKAQGIDKAYIAKMRQMNGKEKDGEEDEPGDMVSYKALGIDQDFVNSFKAIGYDKMSHDELVSFKALGITPEYVKGWQASGFKDLSVDELTGFKAQDITPEYMKSFTSLGYKMQADELLAFKSLGITPEYIKSFEAAGYKNIGADELTGLKSQDITPEFIKKFEAIGFTNIDLDQLVAVKAVGVTPEYIKEMRAKGLNYNTLEKYVRLKTID